MSRHRFGAKVDLGVRAAVAVGLAGALLAAGCASSPPPRPAAAPRPAVIAAAIDAPVRLAQVAAPPAPWHRPWHVVPSPPPPPPAAGGLAGGPPVTVAGGVTAIGDSVMLGAAYALQARIPGIVVDAVESRSFYAGEAEAQALQAGGRMGAVAVIHLGTNGPFGAGDFDAMMHVLSSCKRVVWLTVHEPRPWQDETNATIRAGVARWAGRAVLVDWYSLGNANPQFFYSDDIHLMPAGAAGYAAAVASAV